MKKFHIYTVVCLLALLLGCTLLLLSCDQSADPCASGHTVVTDAAVPASCATFGLTEGSHCSVCEKILVPQEKTPLADHVEGEWVDVVPASCETVGLRYFPCAVCHQILRTKETEPLAHELGEWKELPPSTCTVHGGLARSCEYCDYMEVQYDALAEHVPAEEWTITVAPSCTNSGIRQILCKTCDQVLRQETLPKLAHTYPDEWTQTQAASCSAYGERTRSCTVCERVVKEQIPKTAHTPGAWEVLIDATELSEGTRARSCTVCHNRIQIEVIPSLSYLLYETDDATMTATVIGYRSVFPTVMTIPEKVGEYTVTAIAKGAFANAKSVTSITLPDTLVRVEKGAFDGCGAVTKKDGFVTIGKWLLSCPTGATVLTLPSTVSFVADHALDGCFALYDLTIPANVQKIGAGAFYDCYKLVHVTNLSTAALNADVLRDVQHREIRTSAGIAFTNPVATTAEGYVTYTVGKTVYLLGYTGNGTVLDLGCGKFNAVFPCALLNNKTVKELRIPEAFTAIGEGAFGGCGIETLSATFEGAAHVPATHLKSLTIIGSPVEIPSNFLSGCTTLETLVFPSTILVTRTNALQGCVNVTSLTGPANMLSQAVGQFFSKLVTLNINGGTTIPTYAFKSHQHLKYVTIAKSVTTINAQAFYMAAALETVTFEAGSKLNEIKANAFSSATSLRSVNLQVTSLTTIGSQAFMTCPQLNGIVLPSTLVNLDEEIFHGCSSLQEITIPAGVVTIGSRTANNYESRGIFGNCTSLKKVTFEAGSKLTILPTYAFYGCKSLTSITIPASVKSIGFRAFEGSGVTSVTFENTSGWKRYQLTDFASQIGKTEFKNLGTGTAITVTNAATNATTLKSENKNQSYFWVRE
ncbi:MAG: leucine-rich repeat domain-containing protein [Ruminococcaceae bacterium]|nr:leucine-rich repeat domain-containing protein [Oscillospiraceae bacterium]